MDELRSIQDPCVLHDEALVRWYASPPQEPPGGDDPRSVVLAQHFCNFSLWGLEDEARRRDVEDAVIATVKRSIDGWNQRRNDLIERVDAEVMARLPDPDPERSEQHSETPGQMIDRLSILALKIWHMTRNARRDDDPTLAAECAEKARVLKEQRVDLAACLQSLLRHCAEGTRHFKIYRQFKAYNDPRLNPALANRR